MIFRNWALLGLLALPPAMADELEFQGHVLDVQGPAHAREVMSVRGTRYAIPGSAEQIVAKAQVCLGRKDSGAGVVSVDPAGGRLVAVGRVAYAHGALPRLVRGRLALEAGEGIFSIALVGLRTAEAGTADVVDPVFAPLLLHPASGWEAALGAVIGVERALVDCMFT
jgi:hypothetical protein